jgi:hypothetical protein
MYLYAVSICVRTRSLLFSNLQWTVKNCISKFFTIFFRVFRSADGMLWAMALGAVVAGTSLLSARRNFMPCQPQREERDEKGKGKEFWMSRMPVRLEKRDMRFCKCACVLAAFCTNLYLGTFWISELTPIKMYGLIMAILCMYDFRSCTQGVTFMHVKNSIGITKNYRLMLMAGRSVVGGLTCRWCSSWCHHHF